MGDSYDWTRRSVAEMISRRQPTVCAVLLANGREGMVARAVRSFHTQTYPNLELLIFDSGAGQYSPAESWLRNVSHVDARTMGGCKEVNRWQGWKNSTIGELRNKANAIRKSDIICHFDSDDWSHPNRIAEQVALLQSSGAECVGYNEMLFWDTATEHTFSDERGVGTAWLYTGPSDQYCLGTSMCYWRKTWERNPFADTNAGCDDLYWHGRGLRMVAYPASGGMKCEPVEIERTPGASWREFEPGPITYTDPRMVAAIHGSNTCAAIDPTSTDWRRAPEWDAYCRERMAL